MLFRSEVRLLADIKIIFRDRQVDEMPSKDLAEALAGIETSPWAEWSKGKPMSAARLARLLHKFGVHPDRIGGKDSQSRGYALAWFQDASARYLAFESVNPSTDRENSGDSANLKVSTGGAVDTFKNAVSLSKNAGGGHIDTSKCEKEECNTENQPTENAISPSNDAPFRHFDTLKTEVEGDKAEIKRNKAEKQPVQGVIAGLLE